MECVEFLKTKRGKPSLTYKGHMYRVKEKYKNNNERWGCRVFGCKGSLITDENHQILKEGNHSCVPNIAKVEVEKCVNACKERARNELTPVSTIFKETFSKAFDAGLEFVTEVPEYSSFKTSMYRSRHKALGIASFPDSRENIVLPERYTNKFLIHDEGTEDRILLFATESGLKVLAESKLCFGDGTFKSCCPQFEQIYTIHVDCGSREDETCIYPSVYALLPDRKERTYRKFISILKNNMPQWEPEKWKIDFEKAMIQALRAEFPNSIVKGCNFHYNQCLWREVQKLGLVTDYQQNEEVRRHVRMCAGLAHLPMEYVDDAWLSIMETAPASDKVEEFNNYMVNQWLDNAVMNDAWNCYNERHRTTNALEGWHSKLNKDVKKSHPNILELIVHLKNDGKFYDMLRSKNELNMPAKKRLKKYTDLDEAIKKTVNDLISGKTDISRCINILSHIVKL